MPEIGEKPSTHDDLLPRVAAGDHSAMESCVASYSSLVWSIVTKRVRDRSAAEDLTQEIFTEVWKTAARFNPAIASETTYIAMIARRRAIDWSRKQQRLPQIDPLPPASSLQAPPDTASQQLDRDAIWQLLGKLPDETRELFALHFDQGLTHSEISEKTGLPLGSVKTRLRRGLIEARSLLKSLGPDLQPPSRALS